MNLIGKIFIVIIVVMSVLFMGLSMAVYSAHRNWPAEVKKVKDELTTVENELEQQKNRYERLQSQLQAERDLAKDQIRKLGTERKLLVDRNDELTRDVNALEISQREAIASMESTQANNQRLMDENAGLRTEVRENQEAKDVAFDKVVKATEDLHDASNKLAIATERNRDLVQDLALWQQAGKNAGVDPFKDMPKPDLGGFVSAVRKRPGSTAVEITIGSDDGIKTGHTVEIFRGTKYLGRATIRQTAPDRAIGELDRKLQKGTIMEGDRVATRLNLS